MPRLLIIGSTGFLGHAFAAQESKDIVAIPRADLDFENLTAEAAQKTLAPFEASHAVIAAAISSPDECLRTPERSHAVNVTGMIELFKALQALSIKPIFFSSDHVFNGQKGGYTETDSYCPITLYGRQKQAAEEYLRSHFRDYLILRTSKQVSCHPHRKNILSEMTSKLNAGEKIRCATDQWIAPAFIEDIVTMTNLSIASGLSGVFHVAPQGDLSRYQLGLEIAHFLGVPSHRVEPCSMNEFGFLEVRPPKCTLDGSKLRAALKFQMRTLNEGLATLTAEQRFTSAAHLAST